MAVNNYSTNLFVYTMNGRVINDWGETAQPYTEEAIDPRTTLRRGQGGNATRLDRLNPGRRNTLALRPGSPDSAYVQGLFLSGAVITVSKQQIGTLETGVGTEGLIVNDGPVGRAGTTITDDVYIIEFNSWNGLKGGS